MRPFFKMALLALWSTFWQLGPIQAQENNQNFPPPKVPKQVRAIETTVPIKVDGKLLEPIWQKAPVTTDFFRVEPRQGGKYLYKTTVKVLYNDKNLYFGVFCKDSLGKKGARAQDLRRDFQWGQNDIFGIQLDAQNLKQYCVSFQTTPYGNQRDLQNFNDNFTDGSWNALWTVRTHQTDSGYYAEFAIPFKSLRYDPATPGQPVSWGITFNRLARRDYEQTLFPDIPQSFSPFRMTYAAKLTGLEVPPPSANIRIEPYALYQYDQETNGNDVGVGNDDFKMGGEIKWAINPRSVLDLTFNTDFAQADVDRAVNNLERFNIFFPERRQFFLENSGIWAGANAWDIRPFFSRTIGLQGNFNAAPARIDAGTRFTTRTEKYSIGGMYIHQAATANSAPANFMVGRYLRNFGQENYVGIMATHRLDQQSNELGLAQSNNTTLTIDGLIRPTDEITVEYMLTSSIDSEIERTGWAGNFGISYNTNQFFASYDFSNISQFYTPDMGFVYQKNVVNHNPGTFYTLRPKKLPKIRRWDIGAFLDYYHDADDWNSFQQADIYIFPVQLEFTNGSSFEYAIEPNWQNINFDFEPLNINIEQGRYSYLRHYLVYSTDRSKAFSVIGGVNWGPFYNGTNTIFNGGLRFAPVPHIAITAEYEFNGLRNLGERLEDLNTHISTLGARLALNPRIQLSAFYQYNSFDQQGRWNIRSSWEYRPLSFIYLVFNNTRNNAFENPLITQQFIGKVTYLRQF